MTQMTALTLPLNDDDLAAVHRLIEEAYEAGYDAGKQDTLRSMDARQRLREQVTRQTDSTCYPSGDNGATTIFVPGDNGVTSFRVRSGSGGTSPLQQPCKITSTFEDS